MRTTPDAAHRRLSENLDQPSFGRVELARELIRCGAAHAVVIADLGREAGAPVTRSLVAQASEPAVLTKLLHLLARGPLPDLSRPDPRTLEAPSPLIRKAPGPLALPETLVGPETRYLRADEIEVHTYLGIFARPGTSGLGRAWRAVLADLAPRIGERLDETQVPDAHVSGALAADANGQILAADEAASRWLAEEERAQRLPTLLRIAREGDAVDGPLDGARVHLRAARGPLGEAWLGSVTAPARLERALDSLLTPTQRAVAGYAAVGATCAEIAETLGTRVETVRTHVRDIYARLGISTRAELARRWAPLTNGTAEAGGEDRAAA